MASELEALWAKMEKRRAREEWLESMQAMLDTRPSLRLAVVDDSVRACVVIDNYADDYRKVVEQCEV